MIPFDNSLNAAKFRPPDATTFLQYYRVEPELRLAACADDVYVDSRFFPRKEEEPIRPLPKYGRAHVGEYSEGIPARSALIDSVNMASRVDVETRIAGKHHGRPGSISVGA